jgi:hypothetical protein
MKSSVIRIRLDDDLLDTIRKLAHDNERTIAKQIQYTLKQTLKGETK